MSPAPLVVTSINPFADVELQLRRLAAWTALGFEALTANTQAEAEALRRAGLAAERIQTIEPEETGLALFGRPAPRVAPLLARLRRDRPGRPILLTNADIHPAARDPGFVDFWLSAAPALALTREEVATVEGAACGERAPYRGGLDAFLFSPEALAQVDDALAAEPVSQRMCFGVPGWDFLLGALVHSERIGGRIADSGLLLHETHRPTYSNVDEFAHYVPAMARWTAAASAGAVDAAALFAARIEQDCLNASAFSTFVVAAYGADPAPVDLDEDPSGVCVGLWDAYPWVRWSCDFRSMTRLAARCREPHPSNFRKAIFVFGKSSSVSHAFAETLMAILFLLRCGPAYLERTATTYPPNNMHAKAVEYALATAGADLARRRLEIVRLFGEEWLDHGVLNTRLYDVVALSCENDDERRLVAEIGALMPRPSPESRDAA